MRRFLLGLLTGLLAAVILLGTGVAALVLSVPQDEPPPSAPPVAIPGAPSRLEHGQTYLSDVALDSAAVLTADGPLAEVRATGREVSLSDDGLTAGSLTIDAVLPFAAAAAQVGDGVVLYAAGSGRAGLRRTVTLLGRDVPVTATGTVRAEDGLLVIEPESVDLGGPDLLDDAASAAVRRLVTVRQQVEGLPQGMRLTRVEVMAGGFRVHLEGRRISLVS
jgi:hypothetical protein